MTAEQPETNRAGSPPDRQATLFIVSDGAGATAEAAVGAATAQYPGITFAILRRPGIRTREQIQQVVQEASTNRAIVVHTIVLQDLRNLLVRECRLRLIPHFDLIGPLISHIAQEVGRRPIMRPGVSRQMSDDYFERIDAIQFTVQHDDGQHINDLDQADCVLVGVSRTSKTPLSIYLSMRGLKVANVPIILGVDPPPILDDIEQNRIVALTIDPDALIKIRSARLEMLGDYAHGEYADPEKVQAELSHFRRIARRGYPWPIVDITGKSIEESAKEVMAILASYRELGEISDGQGGRRIIKPEEFKP